MKPLLFFFLVLLILSSCEKDPGEKNAPEIPPVETMFIDFGELSNVNKSAELAKTNWIYSATTVTTWNIITWSALAVPVAAFKSALKQQPEVINDVTWTWEWKYNVEGFSDYTARLVGTLETASKVKWEMYVSKSGENAFEDFLWYEGTSETNGKSGEWILYHSPEYQEKLIEIEWKKEGDEVGEVTYSYVRKLNDLRMDDKFYGSTLTYGIQTGIFDTYLKINAYNFQTEKFENTEIEWSRADYSGRIKAEHFYKDSDWHCWDADGNNTECN